MRVMDRFIATYRWQLYAFAQSESASTKSPGRSLSNLYMAIGAALAK